MKSFFISANEGLLFLTRTVVVHVAFFENSDALHTSLHHRFILFRMTAVGNRHAGTRQKSSGFPVFFVSVVMSITNPLTTCFLGMCLDCEAFASFAAAAFQYASSGAYFVAFAEAVRFRALPFFRLICSFHARTIHCCSFL